MERSVLRDVPPLHFRFRIESFSTLSNSSFQTYESCEFEASNYNWKLVLYPNGNKSKCVEDHISVYLKCADLKKEMLVSFTLLAFDHVRNKYFSGADLTRFDSKNLESGFDKFLPLNIFKDPLSGYLVNDSCMFGADILVIENNIKPNGQFLSMMTTKPPPFKYTWKVGKFSELKDKMYSSEIFTTRGHDWKIMLSYTGARGAGAGECYLYLELIDSQILVTKGTQILVEYKFRITDQNYKSRAEVRSMDCFTAKTWGHCIQLPLPAVDDTSSDLVNDTCILEAEVFLLGSARDWK